ncbi:MAG: hypothetical protein AAFZ15_21495 [Bacteroidota bacterium]
MKIKIESRSIAPGSLFFSQVEPEETDLFLKFHYVFRIRQPYVWLEQMADMLYNRRKIEVFSKLLIVKYNNFKIKLMDGDLNG